MPETNKPFDVRVVNSLERPTINDFNLAQAASRTTAQALAQACLDMFAYPLTDFSAGFVGYGFRVTADSGLSVKLSPGLGFTYNPDNGNNALTQGGVTGVNVYDTANAFPMVLTTARSITVNAAPAAGFMRRDIIAVANAYVYDGEFADAVSSDVFNPLTQTFTPQLNNKTYGWSYDNATIGTLPIGGGNFGTAPIVYIPGTDQPYSAPDDLLTYTLPTAPNDYTVLAVINVLPSTTALADYDICDYRPIYFPTRSVALPISFVGGSLAGTPGARLESYNAPLVPHALITPIVTKSGLDTSNRYLITVPGVHNVRTITGVFNAGGPVFDGVGADRTFANFVISTAAVAATSPYDARLTAAEVDALKDPSESVGNQWLAIGQPYSRVEIALGYHDLALPGSGMNFSGTTFDTAGTPSRTINGTLTLSY